MFFGFFFIAPLVIFSQSRYDTTSLVLHKTIRGNISPKSIVYAGNAKFFAQNMMYRHSVTVYNQEGELLETISDKVDLYDFDTLKTGVVQGGPVEAVPSNDAKYMWVSNYQMYGDGYDNPGCDKCVGKNYDNSFLYAINTTSFEIDHIVEVGAVPKFLAASKDGRYVAVSNWSSSDVTLINQETGEKITTIDAGKFPRGLAFDDDSQMLYVALMGNDAILAIELFTYQKEKYPIGDAPRHILYNDSTLYVSLNNEAKVVRWDLRTDAKSAVKVGLQPRSMVFSEDKKYAYVVNYKSSSLSKIRLTDMKLIQTVKTHAKPIGVTFDPELENVWVACYGGSILLFNEKAQLKHDQSNYAVIVGSFLSASKARVFMAEIKKQGFTSELIVSDGGRYRVCAEKFDVLHDAEQSLPKYQELNKGAWILKMK